LQDRGAPKRCKGAESRVRTDAVAGMEAAASEAITPTFSFLNLPVGGSRDERGGAAGGSKARGASQACGRTSSASAVDAQEPGHIAAEEPGGVRAAGTNVDARAIPQSNLLLQVDWRRTELGQAAGLAQEMAARRRLGGRAGAAAVTRRRQRRTLRCSEGGRRELTGSGRGRGGAGLRGEIKVAAAASLPPSRAWSRDESYLFTLRRQIVAVDPLFSIMMMYSSIGMRLVNFFFAFMEWKEVVHPLYTVGVSYVGLFST
jgi:hypothetical protein